MRDICRTLYMSLRNETLMEKRKDKVLFMNSKKCEMKIFHELQEYVKVNLLVESCYIKLFKKKVWVSFRCDLVSVCKYIHT